jgi:hypothetical protein
VDVFRPSALRSYALGRQREIPRREPSARLLLALWVVVAVCLTALAVLLPHVWLLVG